MGAEKWRKCGIGEVNQINNYFKLQRNLPGLKLLKKKLCSNRFKPRGKGEKTQEDTERNFRKRILPNSSISYKESLVDNEETLIL